jgi:hypothetical protein
MQADLEGSWSGTRGRGPTYGPRSTTAQPEWGCPAAPGGILSHDSMITPGSIHEGGELGYVLVHAFEAVMDTLT